MRPDAAPARAGTAAAALGPARRLRHRRRSRAGRRRRRQGPTLIALAFHRLSPDGRALAHRAARSYVDGAIAPNDFAGVFIVDTGLRRVQTFTTDRAKLAAAVEKCARDPDHDLHPQPADGVGVYGDASPDVSPTASAESVGRPPNESGFQPRPRRAR